VSSSVIDPVRTRAQSSHPNQELACHTLATAALRYFPEISAGTKLVIKHVTTIRLESIDERTAVVALMALSRANPQFLAAARYFQRILAQEMSLPLCSSSLEAELAHEVPGNHDATLLSEPHACMSSSSAEPMYVLTSLVVTPILFL
jgi:hypothetical protein